MPGMSVNANRNSGFSRPTYHPLTTVRNRTRAGSFHLGASHFDTKSFLASHNFSTPKYRAKPLHLGSGYSRTGNFDISSFSRNFGNNRFGSSNVGSARFGSHNSARFPSMNLGTRMGGMSVNSMRNHHFAAPSPLSLSFGSARGGLRL